MTGPGFDRHILDELSRRHEVDIETVRPDGTRRRTTIWVVVADDRVFVRSVRGDRGYWYQAAREEPQRVALVLPGRRVPVRASPADDAESIASMSAALAHKYGRGRSVDSMLAPKVLHTTLRLEARTESSDLA